MRPRCEQFGNHKITEVARTDIKQVRCERWGCKALVDNPAWVRHVKRVAQLREEQEKLEKEAAARDAERIRAETASYERWLVDAVKRIEKGNPFITYKRGARKGLG